MEDRRMTALETHKMKEIATKYTTVSDKIRALDDAGFERADIARFLGKRYQHVRNVLIAARPARGSVRGAEGEASSSIHRAELQTKLRARLQIGAGGRVVIPAEMRAAMGVAEGDVLSGQVVDGELRLLSKEAAVRKAQELVRQYIPEGVNLVDQLIEERRAEAARESGR
jgi:bifunctional DNA-binding transcriptional regulator/antitoxin component of YhaV-PrlF toxin-antitoxin module